MSEGPPPLLTLDGQTYVLVPQAEFRRLHAGAVLPEDLWSADEIRRALRGRRERSGLTQAEVARRAGIRLETLSRIETGRGNPTLATLEALFRALKEGA